MGDLSLGAVVTAPVAMVSIWLKELPSAHRGDPTFLAKPSRKMATVKGAGGDLGGHSQNMVMGRSQRAWFVGTTQVSVMRSAHAPGITKMFQSMSRNSFGWAFGAT